MLIQEHWLLKFKQETLSDKLNSNYHVHIASVDEEHPFSPLQPPRGYGGVAVVWKNSLSRLATPILKTPSIAAIEITIDGTMVLVVSVYMPCHGYSTSDVNFGRVLDQLQQLLLDYVSAPVIIGGDWNASITRTPAIPRDIRFKEFIRDCNLHTLPLPPGVSTFLHHNKKDSAQIDYLLTRGTLIRTTPAYLPHLSVPQITMQSQQTFYFPPSRRKLLLPACQQMGLPHTRRPDGIRLTWLSIERASSYPHSWTLTLKLSSPCPVSQKVLGVPRK